MARGRTVACRASVAVIFSSGITHSKLSLREARPPGAAAGLSQQDQMLIAVAGEVTGAGSPTSATDTNSTRDVDRVFLVERGTHSSLYTLVSEQPQREENPMRGILLWLIGIPIPIIILLWIFGVLH